VDPPARRRTDPAPSFLHRARRLRFPLIVYAVSRLVTLAMALVIAATEPRLSVMRVLTKWDGLIYLSIVRAGYAASVPGPRESTIAFFPGYPVTVWGVGEVTRLSPPVAGLVVSVLAGAAACVAIWKLAEHLADAGIADRTVTAFCFFPSAVVLSMMYSEGLFLSLAALCLLALLDGRWVVGGLSAGLAGAVRPMGIVLTVVALYAAGEAIVRRRDWGSLVAPILAPLGFLAYFAYLDLRVGTPLAFFDVQDRIWHQRFDFGLSNLRKLADLIVGREDLRNPLLVPAILGAAIAVVLLLKWRPPLIIAIYSVGVLAIGFMSSNPSSLPRFLLAAFPLLIPVVAALPPRAFPVYTAVSATLMAAYFELIGSDYGLAP
jgi:hypothetical protein